MSMFSNPAPAGGGIDWSATKGHLLLVSPLSVETGIVTSLGEKDAIRADVVDLDTGEEFADTLVFPRVLQGQLRKKLGGKVLGRLGQGNAKPGQNAPWVLEDFTPADEAKATAYINKVPAFSSPSNSTGDTPPPF